jgi:hypothetical protein
METVRDARFAAKKARSLFYSSVNTHACKNLFCKLGNAELNGQVDVKLSSKNSVLQNFCC